MGYAQVVKKQQVTQDVVIEITDSIDEYEDYKELFKVVPTLTEQDSLTINLNTPGGRCDIGFHIIHQLLTCKCHIQMVVIYPTSSMGAIMALCGDGLSMYPNTYLMFHDYSGGAYGKGEETVQYTQNFRKVFRKKFETICKPFLTQVECNKMFKGEDIYIHEDDVDIQKRLARHYKK